jgi:hypothetical protein
MRANKIELGVSHSLKIAVLCASARNSAVICASARENFSAAETLAKEGRFCQINRMAALEKSVVAALFRLEKATEW